jgi:hypothetical protein
MFSLIIKWSHVPLQESLKANSYRGVVQDWWDFLVIIARGDNDAGGKGDV